MGWRFGQGIGPRVTLKERKQQDEEAFDPYTGLKHPGQSLSVAVDDEEASKHTYPRRDIPVLHVPRKTNRHGLGYQSAISLNDSLGRTGEGGKSVQQISGKCPFKLGGKALENNPLHQPDSGLVL